MAAENRKRLSLAGGHRRMVSGSARRKEEINNQRRHISEKRQASAAGINGESGIKAYQAYRKRRK
jgi:hypothetical protein